MEIDDFLNLPGHQMRESMVRGDVTCTQIISATLHRIRVRNQHLNAVISTCEESALQAAAAVDHKIAQGNSLQALEGVPLLVKDNICTEGVLTTCGSRMLHNYVPPLDATAVKRLKAAGMILVGKANLDQFGMGSSTENSAYGPTHNPYDLTRVAGGSSGGSAAAVAGRLAPIALGSDTGGSVRQPASFCNVYGLKPTYGRVSRYGLIAYGSSLDQIGVVGHDVRDVAYTLRTMAGHDPLDATSHPDAPENYIATLGDDVTALTVGVPKDFLGEGLHEEHRQALERTMATLREMGVTVQEITLPYMDVLIPTYYIIAMSEASTNLARFDGIRYGDYTLSAEDVATHTLRARGRGFGDEVKRRIIIGTFALSAGYQDDWYNQAAKVRQLIVRAYQDAFQACDLILGPTSPLPPFKIGEKVDDPLANYLADLYTVPSNLAGIPALSVPAGFTEGGLPVGVHFQASYFREAVLLRMGRALQEATPYLAQLPPSVAALV